MNNEPLVIRKNDLIFNESTTESCDLLGYIKEKNSGLTITVFYDVFYISRNDLPISSEDIDFIEKIRMIVTSKKAYRGYSIAFNEWCNSMGMRFLSADEIEDEALYSAVIAFFRECYGISDMDMDIRWYDIFMLYWCEVGRLEV